MSIAAIVGRRAVLERMIKVARSLRPAPVERKLMEINAMGLSPHLRRDLGIEDVALSAPPRGHFNR